MIDFRYHLVSLIAVFLAVALGIVIGTTQLNGSVLDDLQGQVTSLQEDKRGLEDQASGLQAQLDDVGGFDEAVAPVLVENTLSDRSVVVVLAGEEVPAEQVDELTDLLGTAGATVTGTLTLTDAYSDPATAPSLESYAAGPGLPVDVVRPETSDTGELIAGVLAQVLVLPADGGTGPDATGTTTVLTALAGLDVVSFDTPPAQAADLAVVLTSGALPGEDADARGAVLLDLVTALDERGLGTVVAGDTASADGGLVAAVRADSTIATQVSTVDNLPAVAGRISTVLSLATEVTGVSGRYGTGEDTEPAPPVSR